MKKTFWLSIAGFIFVSILGTLCHFFFKWSGYSIAVGLFCPVNESVWEHLKLLFFPYLIWSAAEYKLIKENQGVIMSKALGAVTGMAAIVIFFYAYTAIAGKSIDILNILSFFIGVGAAFITDYLLIRSQRLSGAVYDRVGLAIFIAISALFIIFTFAPPFTPLFKDPITSTYGI